MGVVLPKDLAHHYFAEKFSDCGCHYLKCFQIEVKFIVIPKGFWKFQKGNIKDVQC
jgi:hypothetical protein